MIYSLLDRKIEKLNYKAGYSLKEVKIILSIFSSLEQFFNIKLDTIKTDDKISSILGGDRGKFEILFSSLAYHWNINEEIKKEECPIGREFEKYPTLHSLFDFIYKKTRDK